MYSTGRLKILLSARWKSLSHFVVSFSSQVSSALRVHKIICQNRPRYHKQQLACLVDPSIILSFAIVFSVGLVYLPEQNGPAG